MLVSYAIAIGWLLIGVICICLIVYLALRVIKLFFTVDGRVEQAVWLIVLILCIIAALTILSGGGAGIHVPFR